MRLQRARRTFGLGLMASSLLLAIVSPLAMAAEDDPGDRIEAGEPVRTAFWNDDQSEAVPSSVTKQFPPEAVCLVAAQACSFPTGEDDPETEETEGDPTNPLDPTGGALGDVVTGEEGTEAGLGPIGNEFIDRLNEQYTSGVVQVQEGDPGTPADPVPPGVLPVSVAFGEEYHRAAIELELPEVGDDEQVDDFTVFFVQGNPTYSNASPALRQAVLATLTCARETEEGAIKAPDADKGRCEQKEFQRIVDESCDEESVGPCLREDDPLPMQACPIAPDPLTGESRLDWSATENGQAHNADDPDSGLPTTDCIRGGRGIQYTTSDGTTLWGFNLTAALEAWSEGDLDNNGILLVPGAPENFAFGDAETTANKQTALEAATVTYTVATSPEPEPFVAPPPPPPPSTTGTAAPPATTETFVTPPQPSGDSPLAVPQQSTPSVSNDQPSVAEGTDAPAVSGDPSEEILAEPVAAPSGSDWVVWLLLVPFLLGAYLLNRSLTEEAVTVAGRSGALTRLLDRQAAASAPDLVTR